MWFYTRIITGNSIDSEKNIGNVLFHKINQYSDR